MNHIQISFLVFAFREHFKILSDDEKFIAIIFVQFDVISQDFIYFYFTFRRICFNEFIIYFYASSGCLRLLLWIGNFILPSSIQVKQCSSNQRIKNKEKVL